MLKTLRFLAEGNLEGANSALGSRVWRRDQIVSFNAVPRGGTVAEVTIVHRTEHPYKILDTSPAGGVTIAIAEAPADVYVVSSSPFDEDLPDATSGLLTFNGTDIGASKLSLLDDAYTLKVDLSTFAFSTEGTKILLASDQLKDFEGKSLEDGFALVWQVEASTNIQAGLRKPPTATLISGVLRVARIVVDINSSPAKMFDRWMKSKGLVEASIVGKVEVPGPESATRIFVLYFERMAPTVSRMFPNSGSVMAIPGTPDRITVGTTQPLDPAIATDIEQIILDDTFVAPANVDLSDDGYTLEVDISALGVGVGEHVVRIPSLIGIHGATPPVPLMMSFSYSNQIAGSGPPTGVEGTSHGDLLDLLIDDHTQYHNDTRGDIRYYTKTQLDAGQLDGQYYQESEFLNVSAGVPDAGKPVILDADGDIDASMIHDNDITHGLLKGLAADNHTQYHTDARGDARYYGQGYLDTEFGTKSDVGHTHLLVDVTDAGTVAALNAIQDGHIDAEASTDGWVLTSDGAGNATWEAVGAAVDHGALLGLGDDDHTQYATLTGRAGGQTLQGGTAASEDLTLESTADGTKGQVFFGTHGAYYQNSGRWVFGATTSPSVGLEVHGDRILRFVGGNAIVEANTTDARLTLQSAGSDGHVNFSASHLRWNGTDFGGTWNLQTSTLSPSRPTVILRQAAGQTSDYFDIENSAGTAQSGWRNDFKGWSPSTAPGDAASTLTTKDYVDTYYQAVSEKGAASGYASLDSNSVVEQEIQFIYSGALAGRPVTGVVGQLYAASDGFGGDPAIYMWH